MLGHASGDARKPGGIESFERAKRIEPFERAKRIELLERAKRIKPLYTNLVFVPGSILVGFYLLLHFTRQS